MWILEVEEKFKFENPLLSIELVPQSSWYSNVSRFGFK